MDLKALQNTCCSCTKCQLSDSRNKVVFGQGNEKTSLLFIGEGPGEQEDLKGIPFVGKSGQLFDKMLEAIDLTRDDIYIANIVKCRPPGNRNPKAEEIESCIPYLYKQIELINPEIVVCLGKIASENIMHKDFKITKERGIWYYMNNRHYMATFHPSFLLRDPSRKGQAWSDFKEIKNAYRILTKNCSN